MNSNTTLFTLPVVAGLFFLLTALSGCAHFTPSKSIKQRIDIPAETFECELPSQRPSGDKIMESDVARYINSLEFSQKDCRTRLKEIQVLLKCANEPKCDPKIMVELLAVAKPPQSR